MVNSLDDSKIIELFYEHSEQAIIELSNKYGTVCTRVTKGVASAAPFKYGSKMSQINDIIKKNFERNAYGKAAQQKNIRRVLQAV